MKWQPQFPSLLPCHRKPFLPPPFTKRKETLKGKGGSPKAKVVPKERLCWSQCWHGMWVRFWSAVESEELSQAGRILQGQGRAGRGELGLAQQHQLSGQSFGVTLLRASQHLNGPR